MIHHLSRRAALLAIGASLTAGPALARPPFRLPKEAQPLLSPPILDEDGRTMKIADFAGEVIRIQTIRNRPVYSSARLGLVSGSASSKIAPRPIGKA